MNGKTGTTWTNPGIVVSVTDGDTVIVNTDLGYHVWAHLNYRLHGLNAPEHNTIDGKASTAFLQSLLPTGTLVTVICEGPDKYGNRWQADLILADGTSVNQTLIDKGYAKSWDGNGPKPV